MAPVGTETADAEPVEFDVVRRQLFKLIDTCLRWAEITLAERSGEQRGDEQHIGAK